MTRAVARISQFWAPPKTTPARRDRVDVPVPVTAFKDSDPIWTHHKEGTADRVSLRGISASRIRRQQRPRQVGNAGVSWPYNMWAGSMLGSEAQCGHQQHLRNLRKISDGWQMP